MGYGLNQSRIASVSTLDAQQLLRIEAVHRGYLFQHLYAAQCLLCVGALSANAVTVESDEDVEVLLDGKHLYVQVKYRKSKLAWSDIESAVSRFEELRGAHQTGERPSTAEFVIVSNAPPNGPLAKRISGADWPADVHVDWPEGSEDGRTLPPPSASLIDAIEATRALAQSLPFAKLNPDTLVWKLAGIIMLAATGENSGLNHIFSAEDLPDLFEQLVLQLQDLPAPPAHYRIQQDEPELLTEERVRLIVGYSGAGKTSWLAQSAQHAAGRLVYLDVADLPGAGLASVVAREVAGRLFSEGQQLGQILLPGASGREMLQILSRRIAESGEIVTVALDNAHCLSGDDLIGVVQAASEVQFILLCRPEGEISALESLLGASRESLAGWASDTVAAAALDAGCKADAADCQRLIDLTGGLPLYVLNALVITKADYDGRLRKFCKDLAASAQTREISQEVILGRVFDGLPTVTAKVAELFSLCDAPITREEAAVYVAAAGGPDKANFVAALRHLFGLGLLQIFVDDKVKIHDAARVVGKGRLVLEGAEPLKRYRLALRAIVQASLLKDWSPAKLSLFLRLSGDVGRLDVLVEMATDELFHEMGVWPEIEAFLEQGVQDETIPPEQRIMALDGLAFAHLKSGSDRAVAWLDQMDQLIETHDLGAEEILRVGMKRMIYLAQNGDRKGSEQLIESLGKAVKDASPGHRRVYTYNVATAELAFGDSAAAVRRIHPLIKEYYALLGLSPQQVMGRNAPELKLLVKQKPFPTDDIKHLADSLDVLAKASDAEGEFSPLARVHALKFYDLARAPESMFRVGQDLVDQFIGRNDFDGALNIMESILLPQLQQLKLAEYLIPVRSQHAVVLAYCGRFSEAEAEMERLRPYEAGLADLGRSELNNQRELIAQIGKYGPPPKWVPEFGLLDTLAQRMQGQKQIDAYRPEASAAKKVGRNQPCPCGSGRKYKKCHGR